MLCVGSWPEGCPFKHFSITLCWHRLVQHPSSGSFLSAKVTLASLSTYPSSAPALSTGTGVVEEPRGFPEEFSSDI